MGRNGLRILSAGDGHEGILRVQQEVVDLVVLDLNDNGAEAALIAGELKRLHPKLPVIMLVPEEVTWAPEATDQADSVVTRSDDPSGLLAAVKASLLVA
ncbi:MAG TPA: hypothetical protein VMG31_15495 [Verrucomicrobiae bacterium]|nr:hypothetical protein [Verrucomicrobiae bacterium]